MPGNVSSHFRVRCGKISARQLPYRSNQLTALLTDIGASVARASMAVSLQLALHRGLSGAAAVLSAHRQVDHTSVVLRRLRGQLLNVDWAAEVRVLLTDGSVREA